MTELPEIDLGFEAKRNIEAIANRWQDLKARLHPTSSGDGVGVKTAPSSRPPIDLHISDLLAEIERWARFHAQVLMDETEYVPQYGITVRGMLLDVAERYGHFITQDWRSSTDPRTALEFTDWAHEMERKVRGAMDRPPNPRYMGDCQTPTCEGDLYLKPGHISMRCDECHAQWDVAAQRKYIWSYFEQRLMTQSEIVSALLVLGTPVPISTVKSWVRRKRLVAVDDGLYRIADAVALAGKRESVLA